VTTDLSDVMEHLSIAFAGIYEKLGERDEEIESLRRITNAQGANIRALSNRIEATQNSLSGRIEHALDVAAGRDAR